MAYNRRNSRFDIDSRGLRAEWSRTRHNYDTYERLPSDSDAQRESLRYYVAQLINDHAEYGTTNSYGRTFIDNSVYRDSDGFGSLVSWDQFQSTGKWIDAYEPLRKTLYNSNNEILLSDGGGVRDNYRRKFNSIMVLDSDGRSYSLAIDALLKVNMMNFVQNDYYEMRKVTDTVRDVFKADSDVDLYTATAKFENFRASNIKIDEANQNDITTHRGDLNLTSFTNQTNINSNLYVDGTTSFNGPTSFTGDVVANNITSNVALTANGDTTIGDAAGDSLTVNAAAVMNSTLQVNGDVDVNADADFSGDVTLGSATTNNHTFNGSAVLTNDLNVQDDLDVDGNTTLGTLETDTHTVTGLTTHTGDYTLDKLYLDDNDITTTADDLILDAATGIVRTAKNLVVTGDLTVSGTTTTVDTTNLAITDNVIVINNGETGGGVSLGSAGFEVDRGTEANVSFLWDEVNDYWTTGTETLQVQDLQVSNSSIFNGTMTYNADQTFNASATFGNEASDSLTVNATSTFNAPVDMNSTLNVDGAFTTTNNSTLGNASTDTLTVNATSTFNAGSTYNGAMIVNAPLTNNSNTTLGDSAADNLTVNAVSDFNAGVNIDGNLTTTANTTLGDASGDTLTVNATSDFNADANFDGNVTTTANTTLGSASNDTLTVNATSTYNANADFNNNVNIDGTFTTTGNSTIGNAAGDSHTFNGTVQFNQDITFPTQTYQLTGAVTGSTTYDGNGGWTINTTHTADPTLTLTGDVTGTATFTNLGNASLATSVVLSNVDHDSLNNFVANEHIDHSAVSITAGNGLTGGGTIAATRTINVVGANGITANANDIRMSGTYTGDFSVTGNITASQNVTAYSDERIKENFEVITDATEKVRSLTGYTYDRTDIDTSRQVGLIAQEVEKVLPEAVVENEEGMLTLAYGNMVALLVESIKEQQSQIETLQAEINNLKKGR